MTAVGTSSVTMTTCPRRAASQGREVPLGPGWPAPPGTGFLLGPAVLDGTVGGQQVPQWAEVRAEMSQLKDTALGHETLLRRQLRRFRGTRCRPQRLRSPGCNRGSCRPSTPSHLHPVFQDRDQRGHTMPSPQPE